MTYIPEWKLLKVTRVASPVSFVDFGVPRLAKRIRVIGRGLESTFATSTIAMRYFIGEDIVKSTAHARSWQTLIADTSSSVASGSENNSTYIQIFGGVEGIKNGWFEAIMTGISENENIGVMVRSVQQEHGNTQHSEGRAMTRNDADIGLVSKIRLFSAVYAGGTSVLPTSKTIDAGTFVMYEDNLDLL